jgi:predicted ribosome quality control (RQC) complex YloA/Tae2 family protein
MNNLVLDRVAAALAREIVDAVVVGVVEEGPWRLRLDLRTASGAASSLTVCYRPGSPWMAHASPRPRLQPSPSGFAARFGNDLTGSVVSSVDKRRTDRTVSIGLRGGRRLVADMAPASANVWLVGADGAVLGAARRSQRGPRGSEREGARPAPTIDPFAASTEDIARTIETSAREEPERPPAHAIARRFSGLAPHDVELVLAEARAAGRPVGELLAERLASLATGAVDPVIEAPASDPRAVSSWTLRPWPSIAAPADVRRWAHTDAARTAGEYHDAVDRLRESEDRGRALLAILEREIARLRRTEARVAADVAGFREPDRYRVWAEALLAGMSKARRSGNVVHVPDPWNETITLSIPVRPGTPLPKAAEEYFARHRRSERGLAEAERRAERLRGARARLERVRAAHGTAPAGDAAVALERAMQEAGIPVAIAAGTRAAERKARAAPPRLEGVRVFRASEGSSILAGKTGRDNYRLTFQLAGPEDFWLHALGVAGAHVVLRNDQRLPRPPRSALEEAAAVAAHFSEAREQAAVDVQWTRRKYVRKAKGAAPGAVLLKKFETIRVRPRLPDDSC